MPWSETSPMDQRVQFVTDARRGDEDFTNLCLRYGVSRKTGYKWLERYAAGGVTALLDRSRRPQSSPTATPAEVQEALFTLRRRHPTWGGKKLVTVLRRRSPQLPPLAASTAAA